MTPDDPKAALEQVREALEDAEMIIGNMRGNVFSYALIADALALLPAIIEQVVAMQKPSAWEMFCDDAYYGLWAVRPAGENRWGYCFHVQTREEAEGLMNLLDGKEPTA